MLRGRGVNEPFREALTFEDVLLVPGKSEVLPSEVDTGTAFSRNIYLRIPIVSASMDTVTEAPLAIAIAQLGGLGVIHRNMAAELQAEEVDKVKRSESGMIVDPITISPERPIADALALMEKFRISGVPVTVKGRLAGILTNRDLRFETRLSLPISEVMTKDNLITVPVGTTLDEARELLHRHRVEKLLVVDGHYNLKGLITVKDIQKAMKYPSSSKDDLGRLRCGAAIGVGEAALERARQLVDKKVDVIVVDTAHGHSRGVLETVEKLRVIVSGQDIVAGNVGTADATEDLVRAGVDAVKVGMGPGSICTTRIVSGAGIPQITAILDCAEVAEKHGVPLIADGGIKFSGDVVKALAAGAQSVMIGSLFAGTTESPGETILYQGRTFKSYRGMGSIGAMSDATKDRYFQQDVEASKLVPEGIEGRVPYKGSLSGVVEQLVGGVRSGMGYCGAASIPELKAKARFVRITAAGHRESHVHDVIITKEAPNYQLE
ncbi:MAG TPA: IMP dehydrogenase [Vicinamibacteria bacterium]|nr:IMP dehydrogenase [Vicinamibacteria bacterium]